MRMVKAHQAIRQDSWGDPDMDLVISENRPKTTGATKRKTANRWARR
jgi:hypothetical protein